jgi:hypothetical protein
MTAALHFEVIAVLGDGHVLRGPDGFAARCRHDHATADEATLCPWTPEPWPRCCDLLVRQVRTEMALDRREQAVMPW